MIVIDESSAARIIRGVVPPRRPGSPTLASANSPEGSFQPPYGGPLRDIASAFAVSCDALQNRPDLRDDPIMRIPAVSELISETLSMEGLPAIARRWQETAQGTSAIRRSMQAAMTRSPDGPLLELATTLAVGLGLLEELKPERLTNDAANALPSERIWAMTILARCFSVLTADVLSVLAILEPSRGERLRIQWEEPQQPPPHKGRGRLIRKTLFEICRDLIPSLHNRVGNVLSQALPHPDELSSIAEPVDKSGSIDKPVNADLLAGCWYLEQWLDDPSWPTLDAGKQRLVVNIAAAAMYQPILDRMDDAVAERICTKNPLAVFWRIANALAELLLPEWRRGAPLDPLTDSGRRFSKILEVQELFGTIKCEKTDSELGLEIHTAGANSRRQECCHIAELGLRKITRLKVTITCDQPERECAERLTNALEDALEEFTNNRWQDFTDEPPFTFYDSPFIDRIDAAVRDHPLPAQLIAFADHVFASMSSNELNPAHLIQDRFNVQRNEIRKILLAALKGALETAG